MTQEDAELMALRLLGWIAGNEEVMLDFLNATGSDASTLRQNASEPETLESVISFVLQSDAMVMSACAALHCPPETIIAARNSLPGAADFHWT